MKRALALASATLLTLASDVALACPVCAQRDEGGVMRYAALGVLVVMPWLVALAVAGFIRRERLAVLAATSVEGEV